MVAIFLFMVVVFHVMVVIYRMARVVSAVVYTFLFFFFKISGTGKSDSLASDVCVITAHRTGRTLHTQYFLACDSGLGPRLDVKQIVSF